MRLCQLCPPHSQVPAAKTSQAAANKKLIHDLLFLTISTIESRVSYNTLTHSRKVKGKVTIIYIAVIHNRGLLQDRFTIPP